MKCKFIDKSKKVKCWGCNGKGKVDSHNCKRCNGTGKFKRDNYMLVYKNMAFFVEGIK